MKVTIHRAMEISAMHHIPNHPGKCKQLHGHNYFVEAWVSGDVDAETGMVMDFSELDSLLEQVLGRYDHRDLNEMLPYLLTTAENLVVHWLSELRIRMPGFVRLRVWETRDSYAEASI